MMNKLVLLAAVAAAIALARPASAQSGFSDVPARHWANGAVKELQLRGILNGYPDGTFGGKRALSRYEFALAMQRMLKDVQLRIDAAQSKPRSGSTLSGVTREELNRILGERLRSLPTHSQVDQLRVDVDEMRRSMGQLQARAAGLRAEVDQIRQQVGGMNARMPGNKGKDQVGAPHGD